MLKVIQSPAGAEIAPGIALPADLGEQPPGHFSNWRRHALVYQSGQLDELSAGLAAPRCVRVEEHAPGTYQVWLEDVTDAFGSGWTPDRYRLAARRLGHFNGEYLARWPQPKAYYTAIDMVDPSRRAMAERRTGQSIETIGRRETGRLLFQLDLADEARHLLSRICRKD